MAYYNHSNQPLVVVVPFVQQGHLNQLLHFSRLVASYNLPVHFISTTTHSRQAKLRVQGWDPISISNIQFHELKTPPFDSPPPDPSAPTKFPLHLLPSYKASTKLREPFTEVLSNLSQASHKRIIVVYDFLMSFVVQDAMSFPNVEAYVFHSSSSFAIISMLWEPKGKQIASADGETKMLLDRVPGMDGCYTQDILEFFYCQQLALAPHEGFNSGAIHDTCKVIEGKFFDMIAKEAFTGTTKHWALGPFNPLINPGNTNKDQRRHEVLEWLDKQEVNSVIYISFGSTISFFDDEIQELASGLEKSGQKFIWVLRDADKADIFEGRVRRVELPKGYEERLNGLVVREWAPQLEILAHPSTGGFMSHCGWNSSLESISMGVPIAAWPMHSDQPQNAFLITDILRIGILVRDWAHRDELVTSSKIEAAIKVLMATKEGDEIRERAAELGAAVRESAGEDGVTQAELHSFIARITR